MGKYILKRLFASLVAVFVVVTLTFFLMRLMPGSPFTSERVTKTAMANMNAKYGLDKPLARQYLIYMRNVLRGDFGSSMIFKGKEVTRDIIFEFFPNSAKLGAVAIAISLAVGLALGLWSGAHQGKWQDKAATVVATLGITIPSFVLGSTLAWFFSKTWQLLPRTGFSSWKHYVMPAISLSALGMAFITRLTRTKFVEVKNSDYMRTARAKGLGAFSVNVRHGLRNSIIPVVTYMGPLIASVLTGSFVIERLFSIPGLGRDFVECVSRRDYSVVMGIVAFFSVFVISCNFLVDVLYVIIDPRIRLDDSNTNV